MLQELLYLMKRNAFIFRSAERRHFEVTPPTWPPDVTCKHTLLLCDYIIIVQVIYYIIWF